MTLNDLYPKITDYRPKTSPGAIKDFMDGSIHEDFLRELNCRIESMRDFNEECDSKSYLETRGGIKALRLVSDIFHDIYQNSIDDRRRGDKNE